MTSDDMTARANTIYYAVVGEQIQPIIYDLRKTLAHYNLAKIILLATKDTESKANEIKNKIKNIFLESNILIKIISPNQIGEIIKELHNSSRAILSPFLNNNTIKIISNITGGTKIMSLALYSYTSLFKEKEIRYVYRDLVDGSMEIITLPHNNLKEILEMKLLYDNRRKRITKSCKILNKIIEHPGLSKKEIAHALKINEKNIYSKYLKRLEKYDMIAINKQNKIYITQKGMYYYYLLKSYLGINKG